jgi:hypothetical protein
VSVRPVWIVSAGVHGRKVGLYQKLVDESVRDGRAFALLPVVLNHKVDSARSCPSNEDCAGQRSAQRHGW